MNDPELSHMGRTWQQLLAAYADGELSGEERAMVDGWLQTHPELVAELDVQRQFSSTSRSIWQAVAPNLPGEVRWNAVLHNVKAGIGVGISPAEQGHSGSRLAKLRRGWPLLLAVPVIAAAAAILVALAPLGRPPTTPPAVKNGDDNSESVYSVASQQDVEIISVRPADWQHVVVGESPLADKVTFATAADVNVHGVQPDWDGMTPRLQSGANSGMPMIIAPLSREP
jgi:anti-sigma factor RsiW